MKNLEIGTNYTIAEFIDILNDHVDNKFQGVCIIDYQCLNFKLSNNKFSFILNHNKKIVCGLLVIKEVLTDLIK